MLATQETSLEYPERDEIELVDVLQALADPVRLQLVRVIDQSNGEMSCAEIPLPVAKSTASHHLKVMREAGLVTARIEGTRRYYGLRRDDLEARFPGLLDSVLRADGGRAPS
jgi:DNA-binding transcriptional ArsR family regulator